MVKLHSKENDHKNKENTHKEKTIKKRSTIQNIKEEQGVTQRKNKKQNVKPSEIHKLKKKQKQQIKESIIIDESITRMLEEQSDSDKYEKHDQKMETCLNFEGIDCLSEDENKESLFIFFG